MIESNKLKQRLKDRGFNVYRLCERYGIPYKTFMGYLSGRQLTLSALTSAKVKHMIDKERLDKGEGNHDSESVRHPIHRA